MDQTTEEILAAAEEAKKTSIFKRSKDQKGAVARAEKLKFAISRAETNLKTERRFAEIDKVDIGESDVDKLDVDAMDAEAARIKALRKGARTKDERAERDQVSEGTERLPGRSADAKALAKEAKAEAKAKARAEHEKQLREQYPHRSSKPPGYFEGVSLDPAKGWIKNGMTTYPLPASASVESQGEIRRRITATRVVAVGVFALALKKKKDDRELFLTVEGAGWAFVVNVDPKKQLKARQFAAQINSA